MFWLPDSSGSGDDSSYVLYRHAASPTGCCDGQVDGKFVAQFQELAPPCVSF